MGLNWQCSCKVKVTSAMLSDLQRLTQVTTSNTSQSKLKQRSLFSKLVLLVVLLVSNFTVGSRCRCRRLVWRSHYQSRYAHRLHNRLSPSESLGTSPFEKVWNLSSGASKNCFSLGTFDVCDSLAQRKVTEMCFRSIVPAEWLLFRKYSSDNPRKNCWHIPPPPHSMLVNAQFQ